MVRILTRKIIYRPRLVGDDKVKLVLLERMEEEWIEEKKRRSKHLLDRLLAHANNIVVMNPVDEGYVFAEVEAPGLKAFIGEGGFKEAETILLPKPEPVKSIILYRLDEDGRLVKIHEYNPPGELWGYETKIYVDLSIEYDLIIVETEETPRPILASETKLPTRKTSGEKKKKKRRRKRKTSRRKTGRRKKKSRRKRRRKIA